MKKKVVIPFFCLLLAAGMTVALWRGGKQEAKEEKPISVYLWSVSLYDKYAPYIQSQLPDTEIQFIVGNNDLDFYRFLKDNGALPDIITCRRFSLHDAADLQENLMVLSSTEEAGAIYDTYLENFTNSDGKINWLPLCGEADGLVANRALFEQYSIPLPTDYDSLISACRAFEEHGIRGFVADYAYDYTCMELLQALSIPELSSLEGQIWRHSYEDPSGEAVGLDDTIWPVAFERLEQFLRDTNSSPDDVKLAYTIVNNMFLEGKAAVIRSGGTNTVSYHSIGMDAVFLPYFGPNGEEWLLTYPAFQVALSKELEQDESRRSKALKVLRVMLSEEGQNTLSNGQDVISYSQNVKLRLSPALENLRPYIEQNHLYIRLASNEFFSVSREVVQKMILGEYDAKQAYESFNEQLKNPRVKQAETAAVLSRGYSNQFRKQGGVESFSAMANTLRRIYGSDVLIAPAYSFTGSVLPTGYTSSMAGYMVMPNSLEVWSGEMTGAQLKRLLKGSVEGVQGGFRPFNRGSLPTVSGISIEVSEKDHTYTLNRVLRNGKELADSEILKVSCLNTVAYMGPLAKTIEAGLERGSARVRNTWTEYLKGGGAVEEPTGCITLKT